MSIAQLLTIMNARFFIALACYFCLYTSNNVQATPNLSSAEYFIDATPWFGGNENTICDNDPGLGRGIALDPTDDVWDATIESAQLAGIDTSQLAPGTYDLCVRFKDSAGQWGKTRLTHFILTAAVGIQTTSPLSAAEYFIDTTPWFGGNENTICDNDPGLGRGIALDPIDDAWDASIESAQLAGIDTSQLAPGTYDLCVRFKDSAGQWGAARLTHFTVLTTGDDTSTKLNDAEYFIDSTPWFGGNETLACDNDSGPGNGIALEPIDGTWDSSIETVQLTAIETAQLTPGIHDLCVRFQDTSGEWGAARLTHLNLIRGLSACEYYIDQDPGLAHGQKLPATDGIFNSNQELLETDQISIVNLIMGTHTVGTRCQDEWGRWGNVTTKDFLIVIPAITVTTSAATNVTQTSATLNGTVISSNATATMNFEFGTTASYGQTIAATPSSVYSATTVNVSTNKTGLNCGTNYHFRTKAVASSGTSLGLDKTFITATCPPITYTVTPSVNPIGSGTINPSSATIIAKNATASFTVTANSGYTRNNAVSGTCPAGTWNGNVWKTGAIVANCTVNFGFTPLSVNAWLNPPNPVVIRDRAFTLNLIVKSDSMLVSSYKFTVAIDPTKLQFDTAYQNAAQSCYFGICPGANALNSNIVDDTDNGTGTLVLIGQDAQGEGPGNDLQLLVMHLKTKTTIGAAPITLVTNKLQNPSGGTIGLQARGATVTVSHGLCGDSDGNTRVNIVDALSIARNLVGLPPPPTVDSTLADVDKNANITIVDAMHVARYSVGLVLAPEVCKIGVAL